MKTPGSIRRILSLAIALVMLMCMACATAEETVVGEKWINADVVGNVTSDTVTSLKDDFHTHANKQWILDNPIKEGNSNNGSFTTIDNALRERKMALMTDETLTGHDAELVRSLHEIVSNWDARNELGVEPVRVYEEAITGIDSMDDLTAYFMNDEVNFSGLSLTQTESYTSRTSPKDYTVHVTAAKLTLSDAAEYTEMTPVGQLRKAMSDARIGYILDRLGYSDEEAQAVMDGSIAFETLLAAHMLTASDAYQPDYMQRTTNNYDRAGLEKVAGSYPLMQVLDHYGYGASDTYLVYEPAYIQALDSLYVEENLDIIKDYLMVHTLGQMSAMIDREAYDAVDSAINELMGVVGSQSDELAAYNMVNSLLSVPMDNLYIQAHCTPEMREDILALIREVVAYYRTMLENVDWLSEDTRAKAVEKMDSLILRAVYPDKLGDYSGLSFPSLEEGGTMFTAIKAIRRFNIAKDVAHVNQKVDTSVWDQTMMATSQVNAFYDPQDNSINILAGILDGYIYRPDMSREELLSGIGTVIGHEITHAFDTTGAQYDKNGALNNWWTEADFEAFSARAGKLAAYYDRIIPLEDTPYIGQRVQGEAIADMGGVKCMLGIAAQQEDFDYEKFFFNYARTWAEQNTLQYEMMLIASDSHPLSYLRTNVTLQQFDEFYTAFDIQEGDGMYLAPEDRLLVW